jgi:hypothetical protein
MKHILKTFYFQQFLYITVFTFLLLECFWGQFGDKIPCALQPQRFQRLASSKIMCDCLTFIVRHTQKQVAHHKK